MKNLTFKSFNFMQNSCTTPLTLPFFFLTKPAKASEVMPKRLRTVGSQFFLTCFWKTSCWCSSYFCLTTCMISDSDWFDTCHFFCFACSWLSWSYWVFRLRCWGVGVTGAEQDGLDLHVGLSAPVLGLRMICGR